MVEVENIYDLKINVNGGGYKGQAEVICMGIVCVFVKLNEDFCKLLKDKKYFICDFCVVECKKYGKFKVCKSFQFSKC